MALINYRKNADGSEESQVLGLVNFQKAADPRVAGVSNRQQMDAYLEAKKKVEDIKGFYGHAIAYAAVNVGLAAINLFASPNKIWFVFPLIGWGVGLAAHGFSVWGPSMWFGRAWEEKKINELLAKEKIKTLSTEKQLVESQMRMLQAQIEPHFLFNTLANVVSLIQPAPEKATLMLENFIAYLRASLASSRAAQGTIAQEAELLKTYLELLKIRMGERLTYTIDIAPDVAKQPMAPMLLQPVVENAVKHGLEPKVEGGHVTVRAWRAGDRVFALVQDNGLGFGENAQGKQEGGVGLANLRERLNVLYDGAAHVEVQAREPGTAVLLELPFQAPSVVEGPAESLPKPPAPPIPPNAPDALALPVGGVHIVKDGKTVHISEDGKSVHIVKDGKHITINRP
jgi:two-component sensor histidine kinase